ncbi:MAG: ATP synthase F1 subunit epsilon [Bacteroidales bacterium]|nr:ATP synthase F1 subunit epsilon [Bacteroidales bacterium]
MMTLELISPNQTLFSGEIYLVKVPGTKGSFEVLNNHVPIISSLEAGKIKVITKEGKERFFDINKGFIEVKNNKVSILVS